MAARTISVDVKAEGNRGSRVTMEDFFLCNFPRQMSSVCNAFNTKKPLPRTVSVDYNELKARGRGGFRWKLMDNYIYKTSPMHPHMILCRALLHTCVHNKLVYHAASACPLQPRLPCRCTWSNGPGSSLPARGGGRNRLLPSSTPICDKYNKYDTDCMYGDECKFRHVCSLCQSRYHSRRFCGPSRGGSRGSTRHQDGKNTQVHVPECEMQMVIDSILLNYSSTHKFYTYLHLTAIQKLTLNPKVRVQRLIRINPQPVYS